MTIGPNRADHGGPAAGPFDTPPPPRVSRRAFLIGAGAVGGAALAGGLLLTRPWDHAQGAAPAAATPRPTASPTGGPLVLITLYGGNDGLNTVVPYADPAYHTARPTLGYTPEQILPLDAEIGLNPKLPGFRSLWQTGQLAIVRGVGYSNPNLSHFASMDIWQTGNPTDGTGPGWLGRWLDATGSDPMRAISIGSTLPPLLRGERESATAITAATVELPGSPGFEAAFASLQAPGPDRPGLAGVIAAAGSDLLTVKGQLDALHATVTPASGAAPSGAAAASSLAGQLDIVAALINAGAPARVYQVSLSSFDTHAGEKANHERLLAELDGAVTGFLKTVAAGPAGRGAVVMTFSEFGRRPAENASGGTDHGAAAPLFIAGHQVKGGTFYGEQPSLTDLDSNGNQIYNVDFRSVYATVLEGVIGIDSSRVLGGHFAPVPFVG